MTVLDESKDGWARVSVDEGKGYVSTDYVTLSTEYTYAESAAEEKARLQKEKEEREVMDRAKTESGERISDNLFRLFTVTKLRFFRTGFIKRIFNRISGCKLCRTVCRKSICIWWDKPYKRNGLFRICNVCIRTFRCQPSTQLKCFRSVGYGVSIKHATG